MRDQFLTTTEAALRTGPSRVSWWRACAANPGLGLRIGRQWFIPAAHVDRVLAGEPVAQIAADARARAGAVAA